LKNQRVLEIDGVDGRCGKGARRITMTHALLSAALPIIPSIRRVSVCLIQPRDRRWDRDGERTCGRLGIYVQIYSPTLSHQRDARSGIVARISMTNSKQTSNRVASVAGRTLQSNSASALQESLAGSALRQTGSTAQTGAKTEAKSVPSARQSKVRKRDAHSGRKRGLAIQSQAIQGRERCSPRNRTRAIN
jgi:hypothetical protein